MSNETKRCPHCDGTGKEPIVYCDECKKPCDSDGYCGPCADKAVERYKAEHGGRSPADEFGLRKTERAKTVEEALAAAAKIEEPLRMLLHAAQGPLADLVNRCHRELPHDHKTLRAMRSAMSDLTERHGALAATLRALGRIP